MKNSKDSIRLLLAGLLASAGAWAFWALTGNQGFDILILLSLVCLMHDNKRLRKQVRELEGKNDSSASISPF